MGRPREIQIEVVRRRRAGVWSTRLAFRSMVTAIIAVIAGYVVQTQALPTLQEQMKSADRHVPDHLQWVAGLGGWLVMLPIPALALGAAAIVLRPLRGLLAPLATLAAVLAVAAIVGTLVVNLMPLYQVPAELDLGK